jgi:hypothetical protein
MLRISFRSGDWLLGLLRTGPNAPEEGRKRASAGRGGQAGGALPPGAFAVDLSRLAMAAPVEE